MQTSWWAWKPHSRLDPIKPNTAKCAEDKQSKQKAAHHVSAYSCTLKLVTLYMSSISDPGEVDIKQNQVYWTCVFHM